MVRIIPPLAAILGAGAIANAGYMLVDPVNWYFSVPGVTTTGAFNQHFIRDIGLIYMFIGGCFVAGAALAPQRTFLWAISSIWLLGHAIFHLWEVAVGICGPGKILIDFPAVFVPPAIGFAMAFWSYRQPSQPEAAGLKSLT